MEAEPIELIYSLIGYPTETEWIELKGSNKEPNRIGEDISALANSAAFLGRDFAYKIWGIEDESKSLIGTTFRPYETKGKGNQDLLIWLKTHLSTNANYEFREFDFESKHFVVITIHAAVDRPVLFDKRAFIRIGSSTTRLDAGSAKEAELWNRLRKGDFEDKTTMTDILESEIENLLNISEYFNLLGMKQPSSNEAMMKPLIEQGLLRRQDNGRFSITNLGALLLAKNLSSFPGLRKRPIRIVRYEGKGNFEILEDRIFDEGYVTALQKAEEYLDLLNPTKEVPEGAFRKTAKAYPRRALRELLSNMVIHQDLTDASAGPFVGVYDNRIEFCNPGCSLIPSNRILNAQPKTRNASMAGLLRQMDLCEEGGTGWDIAVSSCERSFIAAPRFESNDETGTKALIFNNMRYGSMTKSEKAEALYWHACLMYALGESMNNQSLRERFGLPNEKKNMLAMSRLIRDCCESGLIKEENKEAGAKYKRYIPKWA